MRPVFHFTPEKGWMNDPNGLCRVGNTYHMFYQHYPDGITWGPMYWGHAVSRDLIHWERKGIALHPGEEGYIYSGSAIVDENNAAGFGENALVLFYTAHNPETDEEQQCIAYSNDYEHFEKYKGNPVLPNRKQMSGQTRPYMPDYRDPKVFAIPTGGFGLVVAAGLELLFYRSDNLLEWRETGAFQPTEVVAPWGGKKDRWVAECPDCFRVGEKWILSMSLTDPKEMIYYVGDYVDGAFRAEEGPYLLDYGPDAYAGVTYYGTEQPLMTSWGENWVYAADIPATEYRGKMTLARRMELWDTDAGKRLRFVPVTGEELTPAAKLLMQMGDKDPAAFEVPKVEEGVLYPGDQVVFQAETGGQLILTVTDEKLYVMRRGMSFSVPEEYTSMEIARFTKGACKIAMVQDAGYFELFAEDGLIPVSVQV